MSNLEDLVPPLDLCRKIPFPKFEDSVFVRDRKNGWILERTNMDCDLEEEGHYVPAPTVQEILAKIPDVTVNYDGRGRWAVQAILPGRAYGDCNANPAAIALKVWLARHTETPLSWFPND